MAAKKIADMSAPEIKKLLKRLTLAICFVGGMAIVYFAIFICFNFNKAAGDRMPRVIYPIILLITMLPAISLTRSI